MNSINEKVLNVYYSPFHKKLTFKLDGIEYDISELIPENIWNIGNREFPLNPIDDWKIRKELRKIFIKYFKENIDETLDEEYIVF